jgi:hypothetical protein
MWDLNIGSATYTSLNTWNVTINLTTVGYLNVSAVFYNGPFAKAWNLTNAVDDLAPVTE